MSSDDRATNSGPPAQQTPKLPEGRRQLEQLLVKLDEFLASVIGITEARDLERRRIQNNIDRRRRGLSTHSQQLKHDVQPPRSLPVELSQLIEPDVSPEERAAVIEATEIERELERLMETKPDDVGTLQRICTLIDESGKADRKSHQPFNRLAQKIRIKLDELDRPKKPAGGSGGKPAHRRRRKGNDLTLIRGAVLTWHRFGTEAENLEPATLDDLLAAGLKKLNWDRQRVSRALKKMFPDGGYKQYKRLCSRNALEGFTTRSDDGAGTVDAEFSRETHTDE